MSAAGQIGVLVLLVATAAGAQTNGFLRQRLTLPSTAGATLFEDIDNDGRADLLAVDPVARKLLIYRQRQSGFTNAPDQVIGLPPQTGWIGVCDVDPHPGVELVMSTATGLFFYPQHNGVFESETRPLIKAAQVLTNVDSPALFSLITNRTLPVISAKEAVLYHRNDTFEWSPGQTIPLTLKHSNWRRTRSEWTLGVNSSQHLRIQESFGPTSSDAGNEKAETETIRKLIGDTKKAFQANDFGTNQLDIDGDGRKDLVLWQEGSNQEPKADIYVFLRGASGQFPERPTQVVHCRGVPIPIGSPFWWSPVCDLKGDGTHELVLLELKSAFTSASSVVEALVSHGLEWALTIREFHKGAFSRNPDAAIPLTLLLSIQQLRQWPLFIYGDFNGDGRPDFVVQRSTTQWNIFFSTTDGQWFASQPSMTFETPIPGYFEMKDLNGDGRSDIVLRGLDEPTMYIYLTQDGAMGRNPKPDSPGGRPPNPKQIQMDER